MCWKRRWQHIHTAFDAAIKVDIGPHTIKKDIQQYLELWICGLESVSSPIIGYQKSVFSSSELTSMKFNKTSNFFTKKVMALPHLLEKSCLFRE
jgi:hypothetical protein